MNDRETSDRVTQASNELYDEFSLFAAQFPEGHLDALIN